MAGNIVNIKQEGGKKNIVNIKQEGGRKYSEYKTRRGQKIQ